MRLMQTDYEAAVMQIRLSRSGSTAKMKYGVPRTFEILD